MSRRDDPSDADDLAASRAELADAEALNQELLRINAELERSRAALRDSEARYSLILESARDYAVLTTNMDGRITSWNSGARNLLGWEECEALGASAAMFFTEEDQAAGVPQAEMAAARERGRAEDERWHRRKDGSRFWASGLMMPLRREGGAIQGYLKMLRDRTGQRLAEEALHRANADKDLLLAEVHHRVKNSLQMVQGLLSLQARASDDAHVTAELEESAGRVATIAAIHDQLYRTGGALDVEIGSYLRNLADSMGQALSPAHGMRPILLDVDNPTWPAAEATNLGLILTELVTNALKYGQGAVSVRFRQGNGQGSEQGDGGLAVLRISDDGAGVPDGFDPLRSRGLGMRLVTGLVRGLGGAFVVEPGRGGGFRVSLPVPSGHAGAAVAVPAGAAPGTGRPGGSAAGPAGP